jgi:SAM-dependent methyltransferase
MSERAFDDLSDVYEAMIDWPRRLGNEGPFYRRVFEQVGARRVLDAACGTGHHANLFHSWGIEVEGADISPAMIEQCRGAYGQSQTLRWAVRGYDQPHPEPGSFDVAVCVGNSLALAADEAMVAAALRAMLGAVRPGGAALIQVVNLWRLPDGPVNWQKCVRAHLPQGDSLITKGVHRAGGRGYLDLIVARLDAPGPQMRSECVAFLGLEAEGLEQRLHQAGASQVAIYGSYQSQPYDREQSSDIIAVALKSAQR